jgi:hypothetical protein
MIATAEATPNPLVTTLGRSQLIDGITALNPTATHEFLTSFDDSALALYLEHLHAKLEETDPKRPWSRPGDTAAIRWREARDAD